MQEVSLNFLGNCYMLNSWKTMSLWILTRTTWNISIARVWNICTPCKVKGHSSKHFLEQFEIMSRLVRMKYCRVLCTLNERLPTCSDITTRTLDHRVPWTTSSVYMALGHQVHRPSHLWRSLWCDNPYSSASPPGGRPSSVSGWLSLQCRAPWCNGHCCSRPGKGRSI